MNKFYYPIPAVTPKRRLLRSTIPLFALLSAVVVRPVAASNIGLSAYEVTSSNQFGVINLSTGVFTQTGTTSFAFGALAEIGNTLYTGGDNEFYSVSGTGATTSIGPSSLGGDGFYWDLGSTANTVYGLDSNSTLYSINTSTGASTSIGGTGISQTGTFALSTGSSTLYASYGGELYTVNTTTGALTAVGSTGLSTTGGAGFDALATVNGVLYGIYTDETNGGSLYSINTSTGSPTFITNVSGGADYPYGLAATPEPGSLGLSALSLVLLLVGSAAYRRAKAPKAIG